MQAIPQIKPFIRHHLQPFSLVVLIDLPPLIPGHYGISLWVGPHNTETFDEVRGCTTFEVVESPTAGRTFPHYRNHGLIVPFSRLENATDDVTDTYM